MLRHVDGRINRHKGIACCTRATSGHAAARPRAAMNSRRQASFSAYDPQRTSGSVPEFAVHEHGRSASDRGAPHGCDQRLVEINQRIHQPNLRRLSRPRRILEEILRSRHPRFVACVHQRLHAYRPSFLQNGALASANETVTTIRRQPRAGRSHDATKVAIRRISLGSTSSGA